MNKLGSGSFGVVYRAKRKTTDTLIALKTFGFEYAVDYPIVEISTVSRYRCPYLIGGGGRIYDNVECDFPPGKNRDVVLGLELELGITSLYIRMKSQISNDIIIQYIHEIALGLWALHSQNDAHLDLKPDNIMISSDNHLKIGDFGAVKNLEFPEEDSNSTTYPYAPPEAFRIPSFLSTKTDIWSFGVIVFELVTTRSFAHQLVWENDPTKINKYLYAFPKSVLKLGEENYITSWLKKHDDLSERKKYFETRTTELNDPIDISEIADLLNRIFVADLNQRPTMEMIFESGFFKRNNLQSHKNLSSDKQCKITTDPLEILGGRDLIQQSSHNIVSLKMLFTKFVTGIATHSKFHIRVKTVFRMTEVAIRAVILEPSLLDRNPRLFMSAIFLITDLCFVDKYGDNSEVVKEILISNWIETPSFDHTLLDLDNVVISTTTTIMKIINGIAYRLHFYEEATSDTELMYLFPLLMHPDSQIINSRGFLKMFELPESTVKISTNFSTFYQTYGLTRDSIFNHYLEVFRLDISQWELV